MEPSSLLYTSEDVSSLIFSKENGFLLIEGGDMTDVSMESSSLLYSREDVSSQSSESKLNRVCIVSTRGGAMVLCISEMHLGDM